MLKKILIVLIVVVSILTAYVYVTTYDGESVMIRQARVSIAIFEYNAARAAEKIGGAK